jgi:16S rRNA processing protein RimM
MINKDNLQKIGKFNKPHGVKGEISFSFTDDSFDSVDAPFLICEMDGIMVPFKLEEYRFTANTTALVKLKNLNSDEAVKALANKEVFFPKKDIQERSASDALTMEYFIGFKVEDKAFGELGEIVQVDESTINTLFVVEGSKGEILIPVNEQFITHIDESKKIISMELPVGLLDI